MRSLLPVLSGCCLFLLLAVSISEGNSNPVLYLEVYGLAEEPDSLPAGICSHTSSPVTLQCYDAKAPYGFAYVVVHISSLDYPIELGTPNGFLGAGFGIAQLGESVVFSRSVPCPGFAAGPSGVGEPAAILFFANSAVCHNSWQHPGYLIYANVSGRTGRTYFNITSNGDTGTHRVINCANQYDLATSIGGCGQWGGWNTTLCSIDAWCDYTPVDATTWGRVKAIFR
ncbi:MAG: hypothetical protein V2A71_11320 [Candidatus Eisenbacteria bacterium]